MRVNRGSGLWNAMPAIGVVLASCAVASSTGETRKSTPVGSPDVSDEANRGIHVEQERLGFDHSLQVRHSITDVPHELHDGDTVATGDRIRVTVTTSKDAYLYLALITHRELAIYPSRQGIRASAGSLACIPECDRELVLNGNSGIEKLYLIVSRVELSLTDPRLLAAIGGISDDQWRFRVILVAVRQC